MMNDKYAELRRLAKKGVQNVKYIAAANPSTILSLLDELEACREALEAILPFIPSTSASEGGAARFSANVAAADKVRAAIAKARGES